MSPAGLVQGQTGGLQRDQSGSALRRGNVIRWSAIGRRTSRASRRGRRMYSSTSCWPGAVSGTHLSRGRPGLSTASVRAVESGVWRRGGALGGSPMVDTVSSRPISCSRQRRLLHFRCWPQRFKLPSHRRRHHRRERSQVSETLRHTAFASTDETRQSQRACPLNAMLGTRGTYPFRT